MSTGIRAKGDHVGSAYQTVPLTGGYTLQVNEFNSLSSYSLITSGDTDFRIAASAINVSTPAPGAYSSIFYGNHWGNVSDQDDLPIQVSLITPRRVLTSISVDKSGVSGGRWNVAYDIWFASAETGIQSDNDGLEMMLWLDAEGPVPAGSCVARSVLIAGKLWDVWYGQGGNCSDLSYRSVEPLNLLDNADLSLFTEDAADRGYLHPDWWLISIEAGFEIWQGGADLAVTDFDVSIGDANATRA